MPNSRNTPLAEIAHLLLSRQSFLIAAHIRPDADAIGSTLALGLALQAMGKQVIMVNEHGLPQSLRFLQGSSLIQLPPADPVEVDVFLALDTANRERLGSATLQAARLARMTVNIDHHVSNEQYGDIIHVDHSQPAVGCIIYHLLKQAGLEISPAIRDALFAAISTDTGSFQYRGTSGDTFRIAADLVDHGLDVQDINQKLYATQPRRRVELLRSLLDTLVFSANGKVAWWVLTAEVKRQLQLKPDDSEGLINTIRGIDEVDCAMFFEELFDGSIRVSLRSSNVKLDVCEIASQFGGGGHPMASGIRMDGPVEEVIARVTAAAIAKTQ